MSLNWISVKDEFPTGGYPVLVSSGTAIYRDGRWYSGMEEPYYQRPIEWEVRLWARCPLSPDYAAVKPGGRESNPCPACRGDGGDEGHACNDCFGTGIGPA